jgi:hypothetical protein
MASAIATVGTFTGMWIRKTGEDAAQVRKQMWLSIRQPLIAFVVGGLLTVVTVIRGPIYPPSSNPVTIRTWGQVIEGAIKLGLLCMVFVYIVQVLFGRPFSSVMDFFGLGSNVGRKVMICNACYRTKSSDGNLSCQCGGNFEDLARWEWVDDPEVQPPANTDQPHGPRTADQPGG